MTKNYLDFKRSKTFPYMRDVAIDEIYTHAKKDRNIYFTTPDMGAPALDNFRKNLPNQFIHAGISEQHMISFAGGMLIMKKNIFCYAMSPFINSRCYEQIKCSISAMDLPANLIAVGVGLGYADAGPTHYSTEDICIMRAFPNINIFTPSDAFSAKKIIQKMIKNKKFNYLRLDRDALPPIYNSKNFNIDRGFNLLNSKIQNRICIVTCGYLTHKALKISKKFKNLVDVIDLFRICPLPIDLASKLKKYSKIITLEEQLEAGGFASVIQEMSSDKRLNLDIKKFCLGNRFYFENGGRDYLHNKNGLSTDLISSYIEKII